MELKSSGWIILSSCIFFTFDIQNVATLAVSGQRAPCSNEGEIIAVDKIDKQKCFSCICKNGFVECFNYHSCPKISGCHMLIGKSEDECCEKCQGCYYNGKYYESDTEWTDPGDPCKVMRCEAGVVTQSDLQCHVPCDNPLPPMPGKCCQTCPDCRINGQVATDDRDVTSDDPCVKCRCTGGKMTCSKKACPVLQCGKRKQYQPNGECCPRCLGERSHLKVTNICVLGSNIYKEGETKTIDHCTRCKCTNETSVCVRKSCPILDCPLDLQKKRTTDGCCRECSVPEKSQSTCVYNGQTYEEGQSWKLDECSSCSCHREKLRCAKTRCNVTEPCPYGTTLIHPKGECCPICQESEGTCMVFGDPHYKTFDGKIFSFQGLGKYQLVSDCSNHTFSVRVTNDFSNANHSSTATKRVRIKYGDVRVNLGQRYRIRVNGLKVAIPYVNDGKLRIEREEYNLLMTLSNNVKILWNGQSFLEITVPSNYKNKLCGLCGNFNSNVQDDLKMRKGGLAGNSNIFRFGTSWCVGRDCGRLAKKSSQIRQCKVRTYKRPFVENKNPCKYLTSTELFNGCDSKLNNVKYFEACTKDMCDCPNGKCYCESLMAYAQECQRLGVNVANWHKNSYCVGSATIKARVKQKHNKPPRIHSPYSKADIEKYSHQIVAKKNRGNEPIIN